MKHAFGMIYNQIYPRVRVVHRGWYKSYNQVYDKTFPCSPHSDWRHHRSQRGKLIAQKSRVGWTLSKCPMARNKLRHQIIYRSIDETCPIHRPQPRSALYKASLVHICTMQPCKLPKSRGYFLKQKTTAYSLYIVQAVVETTAYPLHKRPWLAQGELQPATAPVESFVLRRRALLALILTLVLGRGWVSFIQFSCKRISECCYILVDVGIALHYNIKC